MPFRSIASSVFVLFAALGTLDTACAQDTINLTPNVFNFCVPANNSSPPPFQVLNVNSADGAQHSFVATGVQPWIKLNGLHQASGNTQMGQVQVSIDSSAYSSVNSNTGLIQVNAGSTTKNATVNVTVSSSCVSTMNANPSTVNLSPSVTTQNVQISGASGSTTAVPAYGNGPAGWFVLDNSSFNSPSFSFNISLSATPSNVTYNGSVTVTVNGTNNAVAIPVNYVGGATGGGAFTATPSFINKNFSSNQDPVFDTVMSIGAGSVTGHAVTANISPGNGPGNWITVPVAPGTVPTSATIRLDPTNLIVGFPYSGSVSFVDNTNSANFVTVPVNATVGFPYSASPNPLNFNLPAGTFSQVQAQLTLTGPNVPVGTGAQPGNGPQGWFNVVPSSATIFNGTLVLTVTVNAAVLTAGIQYQGSVVVFQSGNQVLSVPVNAIVGGSSALAVTPSQLNFAYQSGSNIVPQQTISVSSAAGTQINFSVQATTSSCGTGWVVPSVNNSTTNGTSPVPVTISINAQNLPLGNCSGNVAIASSGSTATNVGVNVLVSSNPVLTATPSSVNFTFQPGSGIPQSQSVSLSSSSSTQLNFNATVNAVPSSAAVFATVSQGSGNTPFSLGIGINSAVLAQLGPGTYVNNVVIASNNAGNSPVTVQATLVVSGNATLTANPPSLALNYQIGQAQPQLQTITIFSAATSVQFNTSAISSNCGNFLGVSPANGATTLSLGQTSAVIGVAAAMSGITTPQICNGTVTVSAVNSSTSVTVPVTVNVVNTAVIDIGTSAVIRIATGSSGQVNAPVSLTASDNATQIPFSAFVTTNPPGQGWVSGLPQTGNTPSSLNLQLFPNGFPAGTYNATLTVNDTRQSSAVPTQSMPITLIVVGQATATPSSLTFALAQGGTVANQTITVGNVPSGATIAAGASTFSCGTGWIGTSVIGNTVSVGISGSSLTVAQSPCTGQVSIVVPGAFNSPLNVGVTVNIANPVSFIVSPLNASFTYAAGSNSFPQNQTASVGTSNGSNVPYSVNVTSANGGNFFTVTPLTGATPQTLTISLNQAVVATLGQSTYTGAATISSGNLQNATINVTLAVTAPPAPVVGAVVNAATQLLGPISPGEIITIYGTNVGPTTPVGLTLLPNGNVSTNIGNTQVFFDGIAAPLIYVSATQTNLIVPYELAGRFQTNMTTTRGGVTSNAFQLRVTDTVPGIFTANASGQGQGAILNENNTINGPGSPAPKTSVISIYATGEGQINPPGVTGTLTGLLPPFPTPVATPVTLVFVVPGPNGTTVNVPATIMYAGEAPTLVSGVLQVNAVVPASVPSGAQTIVLTVGANSSPSVVTVQVQ